MPVPSRRQQPTAGCCRRRVVAHPAFDLVQRHESLSSDGGRRNQHRRGLRPRRARLLDRLQDDGPRELRPRRHPDGRRVPDGTFFIDAAPAVRGRVGLRDARRRRDGLRLRADPASARATRPRPDADRDDRLRNHPPGRGTADLGLDRHGSADADQGHAVQRRRRHHPGVRPARARRRDAR